MDQLLSTHSENGINCLQHTLCKYCSQFLARAHDNQGPLVLEGDSRKIEDVISSAASSCWICNNIVIAARTDSELDSRVKFVRLNSHRSAAGRYEYTLGVEKRSHKDSWMRTGVRGNLNVEAIWKRDVPLVESSLSTTACTWSEKTCEIVQNWLRDCVYEHGRCKTTLRDESSAYVPSRVLDLNNALSGVLSLVSLQGILNHQTYATLSHCWGGKRTGVLTTKNLSNYLNGLDLHALPQTLIDAVKVCQDLKIRYLWVDSLCIIQDSKEDWAAVAPSMSDIYSNAFVTIAAAAARSDDDGFLRPHRPCLVSPLVFSRSTQENYTWCYRLQRVENFDTFVNNAPLNTRGWVLQERALSRRIIYFAEDQVYWQCQSATLAVHDLRYEHMDWAHTMQRPQWLDVMNWETQWAPGQQSQFAAVYSIRRDEGYVEHQLLHPHGRPWYGRLQLEALCLTKWDDLVHEYSRRHLTYASDKFVAISGIVARISSLAGWKPEEDYLAGHWRNGLPHSLLWRTFHPDGGPPNECPSWSRMAINTPTELPSHLRYLHMPPSHEEYKCLATVVNATAMATSSTGAFGSSTQGRVTLQCRLCEMRLRNYDHVFDRLGSAAQVRVGKKWITLLQDPEKRSSPFRGLSVYFDRRRRMPIYERFRMTVFFVPIIAVGGPVYEFYAGLVLQPNGAAEGQFVRIGMMEVWCEAMDSLSQSFQSSSIRKPHFKTYDGKELYTIDII